MHGLNIDDDESLNFNKSFWKHLKVSAISVIFIGKESQCAVEEGIFS